MDAVKIPKHLKHHFELRLKEAEKDQERHILNAVEREKARRRVVYWTSKLKRLIKQHKDT